MSVLQITCVTKSTPYGGHEHIIHAGGRGWTLTVEQIIVCIDSGSDSFYVQDYLGRRAMVGVVRPQGRRAHIRTYADSVWTDNLLALDACMV